VVRDVLQNLEVLDWALDEEDHGDHTHWAWVLDDVHVVRAVVLEGHDVGQGHDEVLDQEVHVEDHDDLEAQTLDELQHRVEARVEQEVQLDPVPAKDR